MVDLSIVPLANLPNGLLLAILPSANDAGVTYSKPSNIGFGSPCRCCWARLSYAPGVSQSQTSLRSPSGGTPVVLSDRSSS